MTKVNFKKWLFAHMKAFSIGAILGTGLILAVVALPSAAAVILGSTVISFISSLSLPLLGLSMLSAAVVTGLLSVSFSVLMNKIFTSSQQSGPKELKVASYCAKSSREQLGPIKIQTVSEPTPAKNSQMKSCSCYCSRVNYNFPQAYNWFDKSKWNLPLSLNYKPLTDTISYLDERHSGQEGNNNRLTM